MRWPCPVPRQLAGRQPHPSAAAHRQRSCVDLPNMALPLDRRRPAGGAGVHGPPHRRRRWSVPAPRSGPRPSVRRSATTGRHRRRRHRLRRRPPSHDDLKDPATGDQRVDRVRRLRQRAARRRMTTTATARTWPASSRATASIPAARGRASRRARVWSSSRCWTSTGSGRISDVIAALGYVVDEQGRVEHPRSSNLSVAAGVYESYNSDPLTLAAKARRGSRDRRRRGRRQQRPEPATARTQYGGDHGARQRALGADGRRVEPHGHGRSRGRHDRRLQLARARRRSTTPPSPTWSRQAWGSNRSSDPDSWLVRAPRRRILLNGTVPTSYLPYLSLSGTSMAAPVVTGTVALMLQANPVADAQCGEGDPSIHGRGCTEATTSLTQGAGFVNAKGAVELAAYLSAARDDVPDPTARPTGAGTLSGAISSERRRADPRRECVVHRRDVGRLERVRRPGDRVGRQGQSAVAACGHRRLAATRSGLNCAAARIGPSPWNAQVVSRRERRRRGHGRVGHHRRRRGHGRLGHQRWQGDTVVWGTSCTDPSCEPVVWNP